MHTPPLLLVVDDHHMNVDILRTRLTTHGYEVLTATSGAEALVLVKAQHPDLLLLDIMMPRMDGLTVCRQLKADPTLPFLPILMVTVKAAPDEVVAGLDAGADAYLTKPLQQAVLGAWVQALLRLKAHHDALQEETHRLAARCTHLTTWSQLLEQRVQEQMRQLERLGQLKRFMAPQLAELVVSAGGEALLERHRQDVTVVCAALHGFAAFVATTPPDLVEDVVRDFHQVMGPCIQPSGGTLERLSDNALRVLFQAPLPTLDAAARAVQMALAMRQAMVGLLEHWQLRHPSLDFGIGIAQGEATLGLLDSAGQMAYSATGPVTSLATRLCDAARGGAIHIGPHVWAAVEPLVEANPSAVLDVPEQSHPVATYTVRDWKESGNVSS